MLETGSSRSTSSASSIQATRRPSGETAASVGQRQRATSSGRASRFGTGQASQIRHRTARAGQQRASPSPGPWPPGLGLGGPRGWRARGQSGARLQLYGARPGERDQREERCGPLHLEPHQAAEQVSDLAEDHCWSQASCPAALTSGTKSSRPRPYSRPAPACSNQVTNATSRRQAVRRTLATGGLWTTRAPAGLTGACSWPVIWPIGSRAGAGRKDRASSPLEDARSEARRRDSGCSASQPARPQARDQALLERQLSDGRSSEPPGRHRLRQALPISSRPRCRCPLSGDRPQSISSGPCLLSERCAAPFAAPCSRSGRAGISWWYSQPA